jgi:hypothetical protein
MDSQLLAFRLARPAELAADPIGFSYDPQSQMATWSGNGAANASLYCTRRTSGPGVGSYRCNAYGNYCTTWGGGGLYFCD